MAATKTIILFGLVLICHQTFGQSLGLKPFKMNGICKGMFCNTLDCLDSLKDCVVILGNLQILLLERTRRLDFLNMSFPDLREVTGYMVLYRVRGLESAGQLFPKLARIRGAQLLDNYGLIIHDMPNLREVGLYNLLKLDRGGVIVMGGPQTCYVDTIDWTTIAPKTRHVLCPHHKHAHCSMPCSCSDLGSENHCWNNRNCQRFIAGPKAEICNEQCLGCQNTDPDDCTVCKNYTHRGKCVPECPEGTYVLPVNKYCLTDSECIKLKGFTWNNSCLFTCPVNYRLINTTISNGNTARFCIPCINCHKTCNSLTLQTLDAVQKAERCVYINGSLTIHIRTMPEALEELKTYLSRIQSVSDYVYIYGSWTIESLDFLPSLKIIEGRNLKNVSYSLVIHGMQSLQTLFMQNVTKNLIIKRGTMKFYDNPVLCSKEISKLKSRFDKQPSEIDIPLGMNGYSGECSEIILDLHVKVINGNLAKVFFSNSSNYANILYTILYVRMPPGNNFSMVPEACSESNWYAISVNSSSFNIGHVELNNLKPASTYAVCIETYNPEKRELARSTILNFTTPVEKPEPPFISKLEALSSDTVVLRWVNHKDYSSHITHYELDFIIIEIPDKDIYIRDHCQDINVDFSDKNDFHHSVVMKPPPNYEKECNSSVKSGAIEEEYFDLCGKYEHACNGYEEDPPSNTTQDGYVRSMLFKIDGYKNYFQVGGLAPYRNYKFRLRSCTKTECSRSARSTVKTQLSKIADMPKLITAKANDIGEIQVNWKKPDIINGAILSYLIEVHFRPNYTGLNSIMVQRWCIGSDKTSLIVNFDITKKYFNVIRVCSSSLASVVCSTWLPFTIEELPYNWGWVGIIFAILLCATSLIIGYFRNVKQNIVDEIPLVDSSSMYLSESEPPALITTDFAPLYFVPLNDSLI